MSLNTIYELVHFFCFFTHRHHTVCQVEGLLNTVSVVDVNVHVQHTPKALKQYTCFSSVSVTHSVSCQVEGLNAISVVDVHGQHTPKA